jgi:hypothetical protein
MGVIAVILVPLVLVVSLAGSPNRSGEGDGGGGGGGAEAGSGAPEAAPEDGGRLIAPAPSSGGFAPGKGERKIERTIALELEAPVDELERVADQVTSVTSRHGGFVLSSSLSTGDEGAGGDFGGDDTATAGGLFSLSALLTAGALPPNFGMSMPAGHDGYFAFETTQHHLKFRVYAFLDVFYV